MEVGARAERRGQLCDPHDRVRQLRPTRVFTGVSRPALLGTSRVPSFMFIEPLLSTTQKRTGNATVLSISSLESPRGKPRPAIARHASSSLPGHSLVPAGGALDA